MEINELAKALSLFQGTVKTAKFDKVNPHFRSKYATLTSLWETIRDPLKANGLAVVQTTVGNESGIVLQTMLMHSSGQFITSEMPLVMTKQDMQGMGSALSYARRYSLAAILGLVSDDDEDGNDSPLAPQAPAKKQQKVAELKPDDVASFVITIGKNKGKKLSEVSGEDLSKLLDYLENAESRNDVGELHIKALKMHLGL